MKIPRIRAGSRPCAASQTTPRLERKGRQQSTKSDSQVLARSDEVKQSLLCPTGSENSNIASWLNACSAAWTLRHSNKNSILSARAQPSLSLEHGWLSIRRFLVAPYPRATICTTVVRLVALKLVATFRRPLAQ